MVTYQVITNNGNLSSSSSNDRGASGTGAAVSHQDVWPGAGFVELSAASLAAETPSLDVCIATVREWLGNAAWNYDLANVKKLCKVVKVAGTGSCTDHNACDFLEQCVKRMFCHSTTPYFALRVAVVAPTSSKKDVSLRRKVASKWPTAAAQMEGNVRVLIPGPTDW